MNKKNFSVNHKNRFNDKEKCIWEDLTNNDPKRHFLFNVIRKKGELLNS